MQTWKPLIVLFTLIFLSSFVNAQTMMLVHHEGQSTAYSIEDIVKLDFDLDTVHTVKDLTKLKNIAKCFQLHANYPNPFNPTTNISYLVNQPGLVEIRVYDVTGREVATLVSERKEPGEYRAVWDGMTSGNSKVSAGIYFYQLTLNGVIETKKMLLIK